MVTSISIQVKQTFLPSAPHWRNLVCRPLIHLHPDKPMNPKYRSVVRSCNPGIEKITVSRCDTLQGTKISHLWKRKIIFKYVLGRDMLVPRKVILNHFNSLAKAILKDTGSGTLFFRVRWKDGQTNSIRNGETKNHQVQKWVLNQK